MATTCGSRAAWRMNSITGAKDWNGRCSSTSLLRMVSKRSRPLETGLGSPGVKAAYSRSGRFTCSGMLIKRTRFTGPATA